MNDASFRRTDTFRGLLACHNFDDLGKVIYPVLAKRKRLDCRFNRLNIKR